MASDIAAKDEDAIRSAREPKGMSRFFFFVLATGFLAFHVYTVLNPILPGLVQAATHLLFIFLAAAVLFPSENHWQRWAIDLPITVAGVVGCGYLLVNYQEIIQRPGGFIASNLELFLGLLAVTAVIGTTWRVMGRALPIIALVMIAYAAFGNFIPGVLGTAGYGYARLSNYLYFGSDGIFTTPLQASATLIVMFVFFGAFLLKTGGGYLITDLAMALAGSRTGGPAKVAVLSSALFGMMSGSPTANVVTTGTFTIPLMKSLGYQPHFAAAVEAAASTGGILMPPIMGIAAFVMAEILGIPYLQIAVAAIIPAVLYFLSVGAATHFEAIRLGLRTVPREELPRVLPVLRERGHMIVPVGVLIYFLVAGYPAAQAALYGTLAVVAMHIIARRRHLLQAFRDFFSAVTTGTESMIIVALATATAGIVVGVIALTGIAVTLTGMIMSLSGGGLLPTLILAALITFVLGIGVPPVVTYIIVAITLGPTLTGLGVPPIAAHLFLLYYTCVGAVTPPDATAAYAAAGIARAPAFQTGWMATRLSIASWIVPIMFVYGPPLLMEGPWWYVFWSLVTASLGVICLAAATVGYGMARATRIERVLLLVAMLLLVHTGFATDAVGLAIVALVAALQWRRRRRDTVFQRT